MKRPAVDTTCKNSTKRKANRDINERSLETHEGPRRLRRHRRHASESACLVKRNDMKAAHLKARDGEIKDVIRGRVKVSVSVPALSSSAVRSALI